MAEQRDRFEQEIDQTLAAMGSAGRPPNGLALRVLARSEAEAIRVRKPWRGATQGWVFGCAASLAVAAVIVMLVQHPHETVTDVVALPTVKAPAIALPQETTVSTGLTIRSSMLTTGTAVHTAAPSQLMVAKERLPTAMLSGPLTEQEKLILQVMQKDPEMLTPPQADTTVLASLDKKFDEFMKTPTTQTTDETGETP